MKIALSNTNRTPYPIPKGHINGGLWVTGILTDRLDKGKYDVDFYTSDETITQANKISLKDKAVNLKISQGLFEDEYEKKLLKILIKNSLQYQLINVHNTFPIAAQITNSIQQTPLVFTLHDPIDSFHQNWSKNQQKSHFFICVSDYQKEKAIKAGLKNVERVYNGIEIEKFPFGNNPENFIAFLARMDRDKGADVALEFGKKSGYQLKMAGRIREEKDPQFAQEVKSYLGGKGNIEYVGAIDHEKVGDFVKKAKALIFPTQIEEPFGLSMVEAMACGTPVIAFDRGSVPEIIKDGETGFIVKPNGVDGLIAAVKKINEMSPEDYQKMRQNCRRHVEENFTLEKMVDNYEKLYQKIIG